MNTIDAMQAEIEYQVQDLPGLDLSSPVDHCLFVGSGDSYVAGLVAQYSSNSHAICCSPIDIIKNPLLVKRRNLFVVSVSGNTYANVLAAKIAKKHGANAIFALTARPSSRLAESCDQTINLKYKNTGITTAGTISFTATMIKCISLCTELHMPSNLRKIYSRAENQARHAINKILDKSDKDRNSSSSSSSNSATFYYILGNSQLHAISMYGGLKFNEVFGVKAMAYPAEEFCHSPLFGLKGTDQTIVLEGDNDDDDNSKKLAKRLNKEGFSSVHVGFKHTGIELLLQATFFMQLFVLKLAQRYGVTNCYFLSNKKLLRVSSDFIYRR